MALTPEEEQNLREEIRRDLEEREHRMSESKEKEQVKRQQSLESRIRQQIFEEEEERYFTERGYIKYVNRYGGVEWLTPEEAEQRQERRRSKKKSSGRRARRRNSLILKWLINGGIVIFALAVFMYMLRFNPVKESRMGAIAIKTDVPGAMVYLNGTEKQGFFSPDTLDDLSVGAHFVSIYKDGYSAWPPMQRVTVEANKVTVAEFVLKNAGVLGKISVESNVNDFQLYVDGIAAPPGANKIFEVPAGYHVITAVKQGYVVNPLHHRVLIKENETTRLSFQFEKSDKIGYLNVKSNKSTAYVFIDNVLTGIKANNKPFPVPEGVYEVRVCENGFRSIPETELITVVPGKTRTLNFHMQAETAYDTMQIITAKPGAGIIVDGQWMPYVTPISELALSEGIHYLNLMRDDQFYSEKEVPLVLNNQVRRRFEVNF